MFSCGQSALGTKSTLSSTAFLMSISCLEAQASNSTQHHVAQTHVRNTFLTGERQPTNQPWIPTAQAFKLTEACEQHLVDLVIPPMKQNKPKYKPVQKRIALPARKGRPPCRSAYYTASPAAAPTAGAPPCACTGETPPRAPFAPRPPRSLAGSS